jgi:hypothetical protein
VLHAACTDAIGTLVNPPFPCLFSSCCDQRRREPPTTGYTLRALVRSAADVPDVGGKFSVRLSMALREVATDEVKRNRVRGRRPGVP